MDVKSGPLQKEMKIDYQPQKSLKKKNRNERIPEITKGKDTIMDDTQRKQLKLYGHVQRIGGDRLLKQILQWTPQEGKKRHEKTWEKEITEAKSERKLNMGDWEDRKKIQLKTGHHK